MTNRDVFETNRLFASPLRRLNCFARILKVAAAMAKARFISTIALCSAFALGSYNGSGWYVTNCTVLLPLILMYGNSACVRVLTGNISSLIRVFFGLAAVPRNTFTMSFSTLNVMWSSVAETWRTVPSLYGDCFEHVLTICRLLYS